MSATENRHPPCDMQSSLSVINTTPGESVPDPSSLEHEERDSLNFQEPRQDDKFFENGNFPRHLVIKHNDPAKNIVKEDPFKTEKGLKEIVGKKSYKFLTIEPKFFAKFLLVTVDSRTAAEKLHRTTNIGDIPVKVEIHRDLNYSKGVIHCDNIKELPTEEIKAGLRDEYVTDVFRIPARPGQGPSRTHILTFARPDPPNHIMVAYMRTQVHPYDPKATICANCWQLGHPKKRCNNERVCVKCGKTDHDKESCPGPTCCRNCKGDHEASNKSCPAYLFETKAVQLKAKNKITIKQAKEQALRTHPELVNQVPNLVSLRKELPDSAADVARRNATATNLTHQNVTPTHQVVPPPQMYQQMTKRVAELEQMVKTQKETIARQEQELVELRNIRREFEELKRSFNTIKSQQADIDELKRAYSNYRTQNCPPGIFSHPDAQTDDMDDEGSGTEEHKRTKKGKQKKRHHTTSGSSPETGGNPAKEQKRSTAGAKQSMAPPPSSQGLTSEKPLYSSSLRGSDVEDGASGDNLSRSNSAFKTKRNSVNTDFLDTSYPSYTRLDKNPHTKQLLFNSNHSLQSMDSSGAEEKPDFLSLLDKSEHV